MFSEGELNFFIPLQKTDTQGSRAAVQCPHVKNKSSVCLCPLPGEWMDLVVVELSQTQPLPQTSTCQMNYSVNAGRSVVVVSPPSALCPDCDLLLLFDLAFHVLTIPFSCHLSLRSLELALISFLFVFSFPQFPPFLLPLML